MHGPTCIFWANLTPSALQAMLDACCTTGGHRRTQVGCEAFPPSCTAACAAVFVTYYEGCQDSAITKVRPGLALGSGLGRSASPPSGGPHGALY